MNVRINPISKKHARELREYSLLRGILIAKCDNKSELSGEWGTEPHHIMGRTGKHLTDPFNVVMITHDEHETYTNGINCNHEAKLKLLAHIREIRLAQGFTG